MNVAVLGNGQLGSMLQQAGAGLGIKVKLLNIEADLYPAKDMILTVEREHWPANAYTEALRQHPNWLNQTALQTLSNRARQKTLLDELGIATAPWLTPDASSDQRALHARLGPDIFLKRTEGGYDGRGQQRLLEAQPAALPEWITQAIAEQAMPFARELSIIGARNRSGQTSFYELTENHHEQGILMISIHQSGSYPALQVQAQTMLAKNCSWWATRSSSMKSPRACTTPDTGPRPALPLTNLSCICAQSVICHCRSRRRARVVPVSCST